MKHAAYRLLEFSPPGLTYQTKSVLATASHVQEAVGMLRATSFICTNYGIQVSWEKQAIVPENNCYWCHAHHLDFCNSRAIM